MHLINILWFEGNRRGRESRVLQVNAIDRLPFLNLLIKRIEYFYSSVPKYNELASEVSYG